jgi:hypothetical protein
MPNDALDDFLRDFGESVFPHRDELLAILQSARFRAFTSYWPSPLTCAHYARIYDIRAGHASAAIAHQCRAVADELFTTPELPCRLFVYDIDGSRQIVIFTRPDAPERAASIAVRFLDSSSNESGAQPPE